MKPSPLVINSTLAFVALIWGLGFIPQRLGLETLGPMAFNAWRFAFGAITIIPILWLFKVGRAELLNKNTLIAGLILGTLLTAAAGFQQISLGFSKVANVAFITGFYVIFVPVFGLFVNHRY
jgi:drug/metabolite transporter (DMT)-like permease